MEILSVTCIIKIIWKSFCNKVHFVHLALGSVELTKFIFPTRHYQIINVAFRFWKAAQYVVWISFYEDYNSHQNGSKPIIGCYCNCRSRAPTLGTLVPRLSSPWTKPITSKHLNINILRKNWKNNKNQKKCNKNRVVKHLSHPRCWFWVTLGTGYI